MRGLDWWVFGVTGVALVGLAIIQLVGTVSYWHLTDAFLIDHLLHALMYLILAAALFARMPWILWMLPLHVGGYSILQVLASLEGSGMAWVRFSLITLLIAGVWFLAWTKQRTFHDSRTYQMVGGVFVALWTVLYAQQLLLVLQ